MSQERWFNKKKNEYIEYKGRKNKLVPENVPFVNICKYDAKQLKNVVIMELYGYGYSDVVVGDGFVYARGEIPFCLTAHLDTVHPTTVKDTYEFNKNGDWLISSPQGIGGDDRCGVYMILNLLKKGHKPYVVFCEDEEIGCIGSGKFAKTNLIDELKACRYIIELDRGNGNDAVYYRCDNPEFEKFITETTGYKTANGTCSDISVICPACGVAGVNFSCGYYNAHTLGEYVNMTEMQRTQDTVEKLLKTECVPYEYIEAKRTYNWYGSCYGGWYDYDYDYYDWRGKPEKKETKSTKDYWDFVMMTIMYYDKKGNVLEETIDGVDENECWTQFFYTHPEVCFNDVQDWDYIA